MNRARRIVNRGGQALRGAFRATGNAARNIQRTGAAIVARVTGRRNANTGNSDYPSGN